MANDKKHDFKALQSLRRCYEEKDGQVELFWLHPDGKRDRIEPFGATVQTLRQIGYRRADEHVDDDEKARREARDASS